MHAEHAELLRFMMRYTRKKGFFEREPISTGKSKTAKIRSRVDHVELTVNSFKATKDLKQIQIVSNTASTVKRYSEN